MIEVRVLGAKVCAFLRSLFCSYAIGGHDGANHLNSAECFDPSTNMWHTVASMDTRRRGIAVGALEGAIYAVGGLDDTACFQVLLFSTYC